MTNIATYAHLYCFLELAVKTKHPLHTCFVVWDPLRSAALVKVIEHVLITGQKPGESRGHPDSDAGADRLYRRRDRETASEHQPTCQPHSAVWHWRGTVDLNQQQIDIVLMRFSK